MVIKSYLAFAHPGRFSDLCRQLSEIEGCSLQKAENQEVTVLVTEAESPEADQLLFAKINEPDALDYLAPVSVFSE